MAWSPVFVFAHLIAKGVPTSDVVAKKRARLRLSQYFSGVGGAGLVFFGCGYAKRNIGRFKGETWSV